jgi:hypothetical protein
MCVRPGGFVKAPSKRVKDAPKPSDADADR